MFASDWPSRPTTANVTSGSTYVVESPAAPVVEHMKTKTTHRDKVLGALIALNEDAGCIEAHLFLAKHCKDPMDQRAHLERAVRTGQELWNSIAADHKNFPYWEVTAARPYLSAIAALANWHLKQQEPEIASGLYNRLLAMNPNDNRGVRFGIAELDETPTMMAPRM